jgi:type IV pilus assembly protein PilE
MTSHNQGNAMHRTQQKMAAMIARAKGFTLTEVLITMAIIGILGAIALPSYTTFIIRGNRAAAQAAMMDLVTREEQFLMANRRYANKDTLLNNGYVLQQEVAALYNYEVTVGAGAVPTYTITFTAKNPGMQKNEPEMSLNSSGVKLPASLW